MASKKQQKQKSLKMKLISDKEVRVIFGNEMVVFQIKVVDGGRAPAISVRGVESAPPCHAALVVQPEVSNLLVIRQRRVG